MAFRAKFRHSWRSWLAIAILTSVVGGLVLAAAAAGRRTEAAFPQFVAAHGFDTDVYAIRPVAGVAELPEVARATLLVVPDTGSPVCHCTHPINPTDFGVFLPPPKGKSPFRLVSGRLPDPSAPDQVLASFTLQQDYGVHLGSVIRVPFYAASQAAAYDNATGAAPKPDGPIMDLHVVGFEATEFEFPSGTAPSYDLISTPAFARRVFPKTSAGYVYLVNLHGGEADLSRFDAASASLRAAGVEGGDDEDLAALSVEGSIHPQAVGWWILAALAAIVGLAVVGQALARQTIVESEDYSTLAVLGASRRQLLALTMAQSAVAGLVGAVGAVGVAVVLSPIAPLGEARIAESSTGIAFDAPVLLLGAFATIVVVVLLSIWPALQAADAFRTNEKRSSSRPSTTVKALAATGAPPSALIGVRNALERRAGGAALPVGSALLGTVLAVAALCGTVVFGASLSHLTATPRLYGDTFQLNFTDPSGGRPNPLLLKSLEHNKAVTGITEGLAAEITVNHVAVGAVAGRPVRGPLLLSTVNGHLPVAADDIGLGETTMRRADAHVGSLVHVTVTTPSDGKRTGLFRVVSQISFPVLGGTVSLGTGALITMPGYEDAMCPGDSERAACIASVFSTSNGGGMLVRFVPGVGGNAAISHYFETYRSIATLAVTPTSLVNFGEAVNFPLIFGVMLAVVGAATLAHLLVVSVARRGREIGLLKVLGFVNRQVIAVVAWQATTIALFGVIIGVPVGLAAGKAVWNAFANNLGAVPVSVVPVWVIGALIAGVFVVANLLAVGPALLATRSKSATLLRAP